MTITVFLDGLYQIGHSFALVLPKDIFEIQAFDPDGKLLRKLKREKVIKKFVGQVAFGCKNADIIIINQPVDFLELHYEAIGLNIKSGAIVVDTSPVPMYAAQLAEKFLPAETGFVSMIPAFNFTSLKEQPFHTDSASAELFQKSTIAVSSPSQKLKGAENVASKLAAAVGATVVYMDPYEAQEAMVKTQMMPKVVSMAVMKAVNERPSWRDEARLASSDYYHVTNALMGICELEQPELAAVENKEALVRILDDVLAELKDIRDLIDHGKPERLRDEIQEVIQKHSVWQDKRARNALGGTESPADLPKNNDVFQQMFLGGLVRKRNSEK